MKFDSPKNILFIHLLNGYTGSPNILFNIISSFNESTYNCKLFYGGKEKGILDKADINKKIYWYRRTNIKFITAILK